MDNLLSNIKIKAINIKILLRTRKISYFVINSGL